MHKNKNMFTKGQWVFAVLFLVVFAALLFYTYRKDIKLHKKYYKGSVWVLIAFIAFILLITMIKFIFVK